MSITVPIKNDFLGLCVPLAYYFAMLPDILGSRSRHFRTAYAIYSFFIYLIVIFCLLTEFIKFYQIITDDIFIFDELVRNFVITQFHLTSALKCIFLRSKLGAKLITKILNYEKTIYRSANDEVIKTYQDVLSTMQRTRHYYFSGVFLTVVFYIAAPTFRDPYYVTKGNETIVVQQMPLSSWTPLEENYWFSYIWTSGLGAYLCIFFVTTDLTCYSYTMFGICQINILNYFIINFYQYSNVIKQEHDCTEEESFRLLQRELIIMHQEVIRYVKDLNGALKYIMLLDLVPGSVQLAGILFQMMSNLSVLQCIFLGQFTLTLIARIFIQCNSAHNLAVESQTIASSWYNIDWTKLPTDLRRNVVLCILRAQKPLYISIGDMGLVSLNTFLAILKGAYSYMMLLTTI